MRGEQHRAPVIKCFNARYSPNLGDGLLSECLEQALIAEGADPATDSIDLAARRAYGDAMTGRGAIMAVLDALPSPLRRLAVRLPLAMHARLNWRPHYAAGLTNADAVVIGGGNLLADLDLNFPTKLALAIDEAERRGLPVAIYACGVSSGWSRKGLAMGRRMFARPHVQAVFVRDAASKALFDEMFGTASGKTAEIVRDPGLLAARCFPASPPVRGKRPVAGLNLMSHIAIRYHTEAAPTLGRLNDWYVEVAQRLIAEGFQVRAFTNGSPEDTTYAASLHERLHALGGEDEITFLAQSTPAELCGHIAAFDVLVAYRMHAVIAAYSYGIPTIALKWDRKLNSFMESVGQSDWLLDVAKASPEECVSATKAILVRGVDKAMRENVLEQAAADVGRLWQKLAGEAA